MGAGFKAKDRERGNWSPSGSFSSDKANTKTGAIAQVVNASGSEVGIGDDLMSLFFTLRISVLRILL